MLQGYTNAVVILTSGPISAISVFAVQVGVSMLLSFMIVVDLPTISKGVASLSTSRLAPFYRGRWPPK
ncbi:hypothetical protein WJX74_011106 [Apatococcus lobatus]|uniref:Uncharacterized protein n=1 Tax=Apatococcus lobatus TaxID=904363 RepID=A0AAW1QCP1_9CHLO